MCPLFRGNTSVTGSLRFPLTSIIMGGGVRFIVVMSLARRLGAVIKNHGGHTKY